MNLPLRSSAGLLVCLVAAFGTLAFRQDAVRGAVTGVVVDDAGNPVTQSLVSLTGQGRELARVLTSEAGRFVFPDAIAGTYQVSATKAGLIRLAVSSVPVALRAGEIVDLELKLSRPSVVAGRVIDWNSEPVTGIAVRLFSQGSYGGGPMLRLMSGPDYQCMTDDRGAFRCWGISPGQYLVALLPQKSPLTSAKPAPLVLLPAFYPAGADLFSARPIELGPGQTNEDVTLVVSKGSSWQVSGTVHGVDPPDQVQISLGARREGVWLEIARTQIRPDRSFQFSGIPPGNWILSVNHAARVPGAPVVLSADERNARIIKPSASIAASSAPTGGYFAEAALVVDRDITGVVVQAERGSKLCGQVHFDGSGPVPDATAVSGMQVWIASANRPDTALPLLQMDAEGRFCSAELSRDDYVITVRPVVPGWFLRSIRAPGGPEGLGGAVTVGARDVQVRLGFSDRASGVEGTVNDVSGRAVAYARVGLFPVDRALWRGWGNSPVRLPEVRADRDGRFVIRDVPPGEYFAARLELDEWRTESALQRLAARAAKVTARAGETARVMIRN